ncbi:LIM domain-containing protein A-like [Gossypium australe]|uniref:LIM domain-containing protein A-like n=1 Tax=Gossypium australe TaxID=47621 RepID=A0A5B6VWZ3_9ROSI|nr:LIM domain-containing protein A-like [Gossypium australe]
MSSIRLLGLPGGIGWEGGQLDMNTDSSARGRFARMVVYVNLDRPLVSQILINGKAQRVEYEFYHRFASIMEDMSCTFKVLEPNAGKEPTPFEVTPKNHSMLVDGQ